MSNSSNFETPSGSRPPDQWETGEFGRALDEGGLLEYSTERMLDLRDWLGRMARSLIEKSNRGD